MVSLFHLPSSVSRKVLVVFIVAQGLYAFTYLYKRRHGNPMRVAPDEHGVLRFQSMREYLQDEIQKCERTLQQNPHDEAAMFDLELKKIRLREELAKLEENDYFADRDIPIRDEDIRL